MISKTGRLYVLLRAQYNRYILSEHQSQNSFALYINFIDPPVIQRSVLSYAGWLKLLFISVIRPETGEITSKERYMRLQPGYLSLPSWPPCQHQEFHKNDLVQFFQKLFRQSAPSDELIIHLLSRLWLLEYFFSSVYIHSAISYCKLYECRDSLNQWLPGHCRITKTRHFLKHVLSPTRLSSTQPCITQSKNWLISTSNKKDLD